MDLRFDGSRRSVCPTRQIGSGSSWGEPSGDGDGPGRGRAGAGRDAAGSPRTTRSLLFTSGKGGVGTSNLVLNLAIALGEMGQRVAGRRRRPRAGEPRSAVRVGAAIRSGRRAGRAVATLADAVDGRAPAGSRSCRGRTRSGPVRKILETGRRGWWRSWASWSRSPTSCWWTRARAWARGDHAGRGGRPGGDRQHARADLDRRCARGDQPVPPAGGPPGCGWWSTRPGRPRRRPKSSTGWSPRAGSSSARWSRRWDRVRCGPIPTCPGGPRPPAVPDGVSRRGRLARRPAPGPRPGPGTSAAASQPARRLLRGAGRAMGPGPRGHRLSDDR